MKGLLLSLLQTLVFSYHHHPNHMQEETRLLQLMPRVLVVISTLKCPCDMDRLSAACRRTHPDRLLVVVVVHPLVVVDFPQTLLPNPIDSSRYSHPLPVAMGTMVVMVVWKELVIRVRVPLLCNNDFKFNHLSSTYVHLHPESSNSSSALIPLDSE